MTPTGSVSVWIGQLKDGDDAALAKLHARYWPALVAIARGRLRGTPARATDEEDVAQVAFWDFYRNVRAGRVPLLDNRHQFLALLTTIIARKVVNQIVAEFGTQKRAAANVQGESALDMLAADTAPTPLDQALMQDCYRHYVEGLPEKLRPFAELHLAGCTHLEIAGQLGVVERTVERKLALIAERWLEMSVDDRETDPDDRSSNSSLV